MTCSCGGNCSCSDDKELRKYALDKALMFMSIQAQANETQKHIDFTKADHDFVIAVADAFCDYVKNGREDEVQDSSEQ